MYPPNPPLPTPRYLSFQLASGIHTSILMSESVDGLNVAATRQNAGSCLKSAVGCASPRPGDWRRKRSGSDRLRQCDRGVWQRERLETFAGCCARCGAHAENHQKPKALTLQLMCVTLKHDILTGHR